MELQGFNIGIYFLKLSYILNNCHYGQNIEVSLLCNS